MKKITLVIATLMLASVSANAYLSDGPMMRFNAAWDAVMKANPTRASQMGQAQNEWHRWAHMDCKARLGIPMQQEMTLQHPAFDDCMADQLTVRASQLERFGCRTNNLCGAK